MKNRWMILAAFLAAGNLAIAGEQIDNEPELKEKPAPAYSLIMEKSVLYWEGSKPGGMHHGTIEVINGKAFAEGDLIAGGSFEIDMNSIQNEDLKKEETRERLVNHLKSGDFFDVAKFPKAKFVITAVKEDGQGMQLIRGDLTIKGISHEISFPARVTMDDQMIHAVTNEILLDRTRWEVNYKSKSVFANVKDSFIRDEMKIKLDIRFNRL